MESPTKEKSAKETRTETRVSSVDAQTTEHDGQPASEEGVVAAANRVLRILGATVNKPGQTARRAANDSTDRQ
jgi:hypothetical protein